MIAVRALVLSGRPLAEAMDTLKLANGQRNLIQRLVEAELGLEVEVGRGITADPLHPWLSERQIEWYHWDRLMALHAKESKLPIGAVRTLDNVSRTLLEHMPPPNRAGNYRWMGMVVGNVQSGKTATYTALIAKAADAGYQFFIVLSGMLNALRLQTQMRLSKEILGNNSLSGIEMPPGMKWHPLTRDLLDGDWSTPGGMGIDLLQSGQTPSLAVIKKNVSVMSNMNDWLEDMHLRHHQVIDNLPVMVIDDESDEASIDTSGGPDPSSTNRELRRLLDVFSKRVYIGFTATPYANCFIPDDKMHRDWREDLYPKDFIFPLSASEAYTGSERFFGMDSVWEGDPTDAADSGLCQKIPQDEVRLLVPRSGEHGTFKPELTEHLREAVLSYYLAGAARRLRGQGSKACTMLVHLSRYRAQHALQQAIISRLHEEIYGALVLGNGREALLRELETLWESKFLPTITALNRTGAHRFSKMLIHLRPFVEETSIRVVNQDSEDQVDFVREPSIKAIVIGGQSLGRGLTLEGLTTTIFLRPPGNQSTAMQMQRWCGYRGEFFDLMKIYTTDAIATNFREFLAIEQEMRGELRKYERDHLSPSEVGIRLRQHPDIPLVSAAKRGAMRPVDGQYSGKLPQTTVFELTDLEMLQRNCDALADLVDASIAVAGDPSVNRGIHVWQHISPPTVLEFLSEFEYPAHSGRTSFHKDAICRYIREKVDGRKLVNWTVAVCGIETQRNGEMPGLSLPQRLNRVERSPVDVNGNRLGVITDPEHEAIGLDTVTRGREARDERSEDNGLLLVYPIRHPNEQPDNRLPTVVGVAVSFSSKLQDRTETHVAGSVALEDEQAQD